MRLPSRGIALVAILSTSPKGRLSRARLCRLLWEETPEANARHSLSQLLLTVRKALPEVLFANQRDAWLNVASNTDYDLVVTKAFTDGAPAALKHLRGHFLADLPAYSSDFENWRSTKQRALFDIVVPTLQTHLIALWIKGDIGACTELTKIATRKLGVYWSESDEFDRWNEILADTNSREHLGHYCSSKLIGRERELSTLYEAFAATRQGVGSSIAVVGGAGLGKTSLVSTFLNAANRLDSCVVALSNYQADQTSGHRIMHQLVEADSVRQRADRTDLDFVIEQSIREQALHAQERRERTHFLYDKVGQLLGHISRTTAVVIFIDDLQWMDESSLEFVRYLERLTKTHAILLVTASRYGRHLDSPPKVGSRHLPAKVIQLGNLRKSDIDAFVSLKAANRDRIAVTKALWKRTKGHPYLVGEVLRSLSDEVKWTPTLIHAASPKTIAGYLRSQTHHLTTESKLLLMLAAVFGKPCPHNLLRKAARLSSTEFVLALDSLLENELLVDTGGSLACGHDLVREAVYSGLSLSQKRLLHYRIGSLLENSRAEMLDVLYHYTAARYRRKTYLGALREAKRNEVLGAGPEADYYYRLGLRACQSGRKKTALEWRQAQAAAATGLLRRANMVLNKLKDENNPLLSKRRARIELLLLEIDRELCLTKHDRVVCLAENARRLALEQGDVDAEARSLVIAARCHLLDIADESKVSKSIEQIVNLAELHPEHLSPAIGEAWAAGALVLLGRIAEANDLLSRIRIQPAILSDSRYQSMHKSSKALWYAFRGNLKESVVLFQEAAALAESACMWRHRKNILGNLSGVLIETADDAAAESTLSQLIRTAQIDEALPHLSLGHINSSLLHLARKEFDEARTDAESGLELAERLGRPWAIAYSTALIGLVALEQGRLMEAQQCRERLLLLEGTYFGADVLPIERLILRLAEREGSVDWAIARVTSLLANERFSIVCRLGLALEHARLLSKRDPHMAASKADEVRQQSRSMGAVRLFDTAEAILTRSGS